MATELTLDRFIEITPGVRDGKPRVAGRRITVQDIAVWHERMGHSADQIAADYDLSLAEVYAALAYYFDHRAEIEQSMRDDQSFVEAMRHSTPSLLKQKLHGE